MPCSLQYMMVGVGAFVFEFCMKHKAQIAYYRTVLPTVSDGECRAMLI